MVKKGLLDERGLTQFSTLHEMQVVSCSAYAEKPLFGTYEEASGQFAWQTFGEYSQRVHQCRALLKDLGTYGQLYNPSCLLCDGGSC